MLQSIGMIWNVADYRWEKNYALCLDYYLKQKTCIPPDYVAEDGSMPGKWLARVVLRHINQDPRYGSLRDDQVERLKQIGVVFEKQKDLTWNASFEEAEEYYRTHHTWNVPSGYVTKNGLHLQKWLEYQRQSGAGLNHSPMTPERKAKLDALGFDWSLREKKEDSWHRCFQSLEVYLRVHDGKSPPQKYVAPDGLRLGSWLSNQRRKYRSGTLAQERVELLQGIGVDFDDANEKRWREGYRQAAVYRKTFDTMDVPVLYRTGDGFPLGEWLRTQVKFEAAGKLKKERKALLDRLGVRWKATPAVKKRRQRESVLKPGNARERTALQG